MHAIKQVILPAIVAVSALLFSSASLAHQLKSSVTTVLFNKRTHNIELMHRFYLHDTEHAIEHIVGKQADMLNSKSDQQQFADYVAQHVAIKTPQSESMPLKNVGFEVDGKFFWVYQEAAMPKQALTGLQMSHGALQELWPTQVNMVNIEGQGKVRTVYFDQENQWHTVTF